MDAAEGSEFETKALEARILVVNRAAMGTSTIVGTFSRSIFVPSTFPRGAVEFLNSMSVITGTYNYYRRLPKRYLTWQVGHPMLSRSGVSRRRRYVCMGIRGHLWAL